VGLVLDAYFVGEEGTGGYELAAGVGAGDGHPGSSAKARRSLAIVQPCEPQVSLGDKTKNSAWRRRVVAGGATRSSDGGPQDRPPLEKPGTEGF
jgi:hypothetical protein